MVAHRDDGPAPYGPGHEVAPGYRVIEHLRRGADLDAYDAWSEERFCRCFLKTLRPDRVEAAGVRGRLLLEGRLLLRFTHPNLVRAYDVVEPGPSQAPILVLETLGGATLDYILGESQRLPALDIAHLGRHLCSAIRYMHGQGYLHMDVKPGNVIAEGGRARLIDLSLARRPGQSHRQFGTPGYMAPEQAFGGDLSPAADVWGIGLVLYEAATGLRPYAPPEDMAPSSTDPYWPLAYEPVAPVRTARRLPRPLAAAIDGCLRLRPADRIGMAQLWAAIAEVTGEEGPTAGRPPVRDAEVS